MSRHLTSILFVSIALAWSNGAAPGTVPESPT